MSDMNAIAINELKFGYHPNNPLIQIEQLTIQAGEHVFLHGASGSGKSTLLNLISGILTPQSGDITLLEKPFSRLSSAQRDAFRANHIGVIFQEFNLIPFLTVFENIELAHFFSKKNQGHPHKKTDYKNNIELLLEQLKLNKNLLNKRADQLSVGQRQRVSIARALINQPEIIIADEPTSALDTDNRDDFMHLLLDITSADEQPNSTVIFVSHDKGLANYFNRHIDITELTTES